MNFNQFIRERIKKCKSENNGKSKSLVFPEGYDVRTLEAISKIEKEGFTEKIIVLGEKDKILSDCKVNNINLKNVEIRDNKKDNIQEYAHKLYEIRKHKGMTEAEAENTIKNELYYGAMLVRENIVDGMVGGAMNTTANVLRAAIQIIGTAQGIKTVSSSFMMIVKDHSFGANGKLFFSDAAVVPDPTPEQLADITIASATLWKKLTGEEPIVALLSFSTKGSASHPMVDKIIQTYKILTQRNVNFKFDGELQADAALVKKVAEQKAPNSVVGGFANVLIFPDLNAGNISYKLVQRLGGAEAYGPLLQGLAKPVNDLSRGCSSDDIVNVAAITVLECFE
ncbi:MAG TPA: phosphate acetyltransferase [bacterium]|nr:phosphate acetyltransferase [bacterium]HOL48611.1 phosphate acetyltransferase [bacterium]HPQ19045.1 phosphate acetyltransferase [bacterium]